MEIILLMNKHRMHAELQSSVVLMWVGMYVYVRVAFSLRIAFDSIPNSRLAHDVCRCSEFEFNYSMELRALANASTAYVCSIMSMEEKENIVIVLAMAWYCCC